MRKIGRPPLHMGYYQESHLAGLVASIRETGLLEPVVVCKTQGEEYLILSGHYRVRAVRRLRQKTVLCRVVVCDTRRAAVIYCASNLLTRGLSAIEEAYIIWRLAAQEQFTLAEIGRLWGRSKSWVSRRMALLVHLEPKLRKELGAGRLSPRVAQELIRLPRGNDRERVLKIILRDYLNKDEAAQLVTWWKTAGEEEKKAVEKNGYPGNKKTAPGSTDRSLIRLVTRDFYQCRQILTRITELVAAQSRLSWWPLATYRSFQRVVTQLESMVKARFFSTGR